MAAKEKDQRGARAPSAVGHPTNDYGLRSTATKQGLKKGDKKGDVPRALVDYVKTNRLADTKRLDRLNVIRSTPSGTFQAICPLCYRRIFAAGLQTKLTQVVGREVADSTVTEVNLFLLRASVQVSTTTKPTGLAGGTITATHWLATTAYRRRFSGCGRSSRPSNGDPTHKHWRVDPGRDRRIPHGPLQDR